MSKLNEHEMQRYVLNELQKQDSKQQVIRKENYESIALRYHDLSKQLALLEMEENSQAKQQLIQEVKGELDNFSALVQTGNKALDIVLTDKKMVCLKNEIKLFSKVNEHVLDFMDEVDVYTIFSNLFDNAIESLKDEDKENKIIKLNIHQKGSIISIDCQNYTSKDIVFRNNMPQTSKDNKEFHGYGTLSIKKAVKKYHGSVVYRLENSIFHAYIILQNQGQETPKEQENVQPATV
jgi:sensor histidine kinase regulating citrate/malate metabolism